jgi:hypothetical protein
VVEALEDLSSAAPASKVLGGAGGASGGSCARRGGAILLKSASRPRCEASQSVRGGSGIATR